MQTPFYQKVFEIVNIFSFSVGIFGRFFIGMPISAGSRYHDELIFTAVRIAAFTMLSQHSKYSAGCSRLLSISYHSHYIFSFPVAVIVPCAYTHRRTVCVRKSCCACLSRRFFLFHVDVPLPVCIPISCLYFVERLNAISPLCTC